MSQRDTKIVSKNVSNREKGQLFPVQRAIIIFYIKKRSIIVYVYEFSLKSRQKMPHLLKMIRR